MKKYLINCSKLSLREIIFAESIAKKLKAEDTDNIVDYCLPDQQMSSLLNEDPYINSVFTEIPSLEYDVSLELPPSDNNEIPTIQYQKLVGILEPTSEYCIYTNKQIDVNVDNQITQLLSQREWKPIVGFVEGWENDSHILTPETPLGINTSKRNINQLLEYLNNHVWLVALGSPFNITDPNFLAFNASLMSFMNWVIGPIGLLTTMAAGLGTSTIVTADSAWNKTENLMSPFPFFHGKNHWTIGPFVPDEELGPEIVQIITNDLHQISQETSS